MDFEKEIRVEKKLRTFKGFIPFMTLAAGAVFLTANYFLMLEFEKGLYWLIIPSGLILHAFMITLVHEASHKAITGNLIADSIIANIAAGFVFIPVYAEFFRRYHLLHHAHTNESIDPLWPDEKRWLFENHKRVFVIIELIPVLTTIILIILGEKKRKKVAKGPKVRWGYIGLSVLVSLLIGFLIEPSVLFLVGSVLVAGVVAKVRNWCEHTGLDETKESNTYWFPLGMGIGNHEAHHAHPKISWVTNQYCLWTKKRSTNPIKTTLSMFFNKNHKHYLPKKTKLD